MDPRPRCDEPVNRYRANTSYYRDEDPVVGDWHEEDIAAGYGWPICQARPPPYCSGAERRTFPLRLLSPLNVDRLRSMTKIAQAVSSFGSGAHRTAAKSDGCAVPRPATRLLPPVTSTSHGISSPRSSSRLRPHGRHFSSCSATRTRLGRARATWAIMNGRKSGQTWPSALHVRVGRIGRQERDGAGRRDEEHRVQVACVSHGAPECECAGRHHGHQEAGAHGTCPVKSGSC